MSEQPEQYDENPPETPDQNEAGEGEENSFAPVQDEARPDSTGVTTGF